MNSKKYLLKLIDVQNQLNSIGNSQLNVNRYEAYFNVVCKDTDLMAISDILNKELGIFFCFCDKTYNNKANIIFEGLGWYAYIDAPMPKHTALNIVRQINDDVGFDKNDNIDIPKIFVALQKLLYTLNAVGVSAKINSDNWILDIACPINKFMHILHILQSTLGDIICVDSSASQYIEECTFKFKTAYSDNTVSIICSDIFDSL